MFRRLYIKTDGIFNYSDYKKAKGKVAYSIFFILLAIAALFSLAPVVWLFLSAFKTPTEFYSSTYTLLPNQFNFGKFLEVFKFLDFGKYFVNSIIVIVGAVICSVFFNGLMAYSISMIKPKGHKIVYSLVLASMMIPALTSIVPLFNSLVKLKLINSYLPLWLIYGANAFNILMFKNYFDNITKSLLEASKLDGCNKMQFFFKMLIPLSLPIIGVICIFTVNGAWSDFMLPYLVLLKDSQKTVMLKIYVLNSTLGSMPGFGIDKLLIVLIISIIPPVILFLIFQKQITSSVSTAGMKD